MKTTTAAGRTWHFSHALGRYSNEHEGKTGGYTCPVDVAIAPDGNLFVLSRGYGFPQEPGTPNHTTRIGKTSIEEDHFGDFGRTSFTMANSIAVSHDGNVYCTDEHENVVAIYPPDVIYPHPTHNPDGERIGEWGATGTSSGDLNGPSGIAFDHNDDVLIVDSKNDRIQNFSKNGRYLSGWGRSGSGEGEFDRPWGIAIDANGNVYVADWGNSRVQKFTADGEYLVSFGESDLDGGKLDHPAAVAVDTDGDVYVCDWGNRRVQMFEPDGSAITALYGDANHPKDSKAGIYVLNRNPQVWDAFLRVDDWTPLGMFGRPVGIEVDTEGRVIIVDTRGRLQVYQKDNDYIEPDIKLEL